MINDTVFADFFNRLMVALDAAGLISQPDTRSIDELRSGWTWPVSPQLSATFEPEESAANDLVEAIHSAGGCHLLSRRDRARLTERDTLSSFVEYAHAMIDGDPMFPAELASALSETSRPERGAAIFFALLHARAFAEIVSRLSATIYHFELLCGLRILAASVQRPPRPLSERLRQMTRDLRRSRTPLANIIYSGNRRRRNEGAFGLMERSRGIAWVHQLHIELQMTHLLELRKEWEDKPANVRMAAADSPNSVEVRLFDQLRDRQRAVNEARRRRNEQNDQLQEIMARWRVAVQPEKGRIFLEERRPAEVTLQQRRAEFREANNQLEEIESSLPPGLVERVENYRAAQARGLHASSFIGDRDAKLAALDQGLGNTPPLYLAVPEEDQRWENYIDFLTVLVDEETNLNTQFFSWCFLRACQFSELSRDIGFSLADQREYSWVTRPGHHNEAVDMNGPRHTLHVSVPEQFTLPTRFVEGDASAVTFDYLDSVVHRLNQPNERQDVFAKLARGLLGSRSRRRQIDNVFSEFGTQRLAPDFVRRQTFSSRQLELIIMALFASNLTARNNLGRLATERHRLSGRLEVGIARALQISSSVNIIDRVRADAGHGRRFSIATAFRGVAGVRRGQIVPTLRRLLQSTAGESGTGRQVPLLDDLWRFLLNLHRSGAELSSGSGSLSLRHNFHAPDGQRLQIEVYHSHLYAVFPASGTAIARGDRIGLVGATGNAANGHLHIEFKLTLGSRLLGHCYPHEFFPLR